MKTEEFIVKCKETHGDKYDYANVEYKNPKTVITIFCKIHKVYFTQNGYAHMRGATSCKQCISEIRRNINILNEEDFLKRCQEVDLKKGNHIKYLSKYINMNSPIKVECLDCGEVWEQLACNRAKGQGCPNCKGVKVLTKEKFIERAKKIHGDKYDYSFVDYKNAWEKVKVFCKSCNTFFLVFPHLHAGTSNQTGCPHCLESKGVRKIRVYLENNNIEFEQEYKLNNVFLDFYIPSKKIALEIDGEQHFIKEHYFNKRNAKKNNITLDECFQHNQELEKLKAEYCKKNGILLIRIPYWDCDNIEKILDDYLSSLA